MEDEETTPTLPMLCLANRVLFPGEILPMHIYNSHVRPHTQPLLTHSLPLSHTHTLFHTLSHTHAHTNTHSHTYMQAIEMLRDAATRHKPVAIVTDFRKNSQIRQMMRPTMKDLSRVSSLSYMHTDTQTHTHTHAHTQMHTHTHTLAGGYDSRGDGHEGRR